MSEPTHAPTLVEALAALITEFIEYEDFSFHPGRLAERLASAFQQVGWYSDHMDKLRVEHGHSNDAPVYRFVSEAD